MKIKKGLDIEDFKAMELLESCCYNKRYIANMEDAVDWYKSYPYTTVAAYSDDDLAGFINYFPVKKEVFEALKSGTFGDRKLSIDDIEDIGGEGPFYMFFCNIAVSPFFQERGLAMFLVRAAFEQYRFIEYRCVEVISDNLTKDGEILSKRLGLDFHCESDYGSKIYYAKYEDFLDAIN